MVITVLKQTFQRSSPKDPLYKDYKNLDRLTFKRELEEKLNQLINEYKHFKQIFLEVLNTHAPIKRKLLRANHVPYMTKALRKAIMKRSELESKYVKNKTNENLKSYKKQRNFCSKLYKKERKKYYEMLDLKNVTDNKDESKVANLFSDFFESAICSLGIKANEHSQENYDFKNPVEIAIKKFEQQPSINITKNYSLIKLNNKESR